MSDASTGTLSVDGRVVAYEQATGGPGVPLLLLHGFAGGRHDFRAVLGGLGRDRRALAVDLPGHGDSGGPGDPAAYELSRLAAWVVRLLDALELDEAHLLGHALGGLLAQRVAAAASQRLRGLVLSGTGLGAPREEVGERLVRLALAARDGGPQAALAAGGEALADGDAGAALERLRRVRPPALVGAARSVLTAEPLGAFLHGIDVPVLVVHGERDGHWTLAEQRLLADTVAGARRVCVRGAGASAHRDRPAAWLDVVRPFLRRAENAPQSGTSAR